MNNSVYKFQLMAQSCRVSKMLTARSFFGREILPIGTAALLFSFPSCVDCGKILTV